MTRKRLAAAFRTTCINVAVNTLLAWLKITVGLHGNSQSLVADGVHSLADLITDALVLITSKIGAQAPDQEHPYGHGRLETLGTIVMAAILIAVGVGLLFHSTQQFLAGYKTLIATQPVLWIAIVSVLANEALYHYTTFEGRKVHSKLILANAWHNRSDAMVSGLVVVSVLGSWAHIPYLDLIGSVIIAALICKMGASMIWDSLKELVDTGLDLPTLEKITHTIESIPGIMALHQLRSRMHSGYILLDVHIQVSPKITVSESHYLAETACAKLNKNDRRITDVTVHVDPEDDTLQKTDLSLPIREEILPLLQKQWQHLPLHKHIQTTQLHYLSGAIEIDLLLEIDLSQFQNIDAHNLQKRYLQQAQRCHSKIDQLKLFFSQKERHKP